MTNQTKKTGRPTGSLGGDSLTTQLLALDLGDSVLLPAVGLRPFPNYAGTVKRAKAHKPEREWKLETCYGFAVSMEDQPFKFYRIVRTN